MPDTANFAGLRVAAFESRRAEEIASLIARLGGRPAVSPSLREVPLGENPAAIDFARQILASQLDILIFMTGVGIRHFLAEVEGHLDRTQLLAAISRTATIVRGPKPAAVLKELGVVPSYRVDEPNTWREVLATLDANLPVAGRQVGIQEYGIPNLQLTAELTARGASVHTLCVYRWELPEDIAPLEQNVRDIAAGEIDVVLFTSSQQAINLLLVAERLGLADRLRQQLTRTVVASIGPTTSETLHEQQLPVDLQPEHARMGQLVVAAAANSLALLAAKRASAVPAANLSTGLSSLQPSSELDRGSQSGSTQPSWYDSPFMRACRREPNVRTPIWLMRQAGRYLPEYRKIRSQVTFLELCKRPDLSAEVMIRTVERLGVDAAIIFSDLLPILEPMGFDLEYTQGEGPVIHNPLRAADVDRVRELDSVAKLDFVMQTVRETRAGIAPQIPVLGFAGAPFTLASYAIEGGSSRNYLFTKQLMYTDEGAWTALMGRLARAVGRYLNAQLAAGAQAVQLFDSWAGCLSPDDYRRYCLPHTKAVIDMITPGAPVINFATGNPMLLPLLAEAGGAVIGVDWRVRLDEAWRSIGYDHGVQGNLDPVLLLADRATIRTAAHHILELAGGRPGHIFNLGHGVLPQTPPEHVDVLIDAVRSYPR